MKYILKFILWAQVQLTNLFEYLRRSRSKKVLKKENKNVVNTRTTFKNYSKTLLKETGDFTTDDMANFYTKGIGKEFSERLINKKPGGGISWQEQEVKRRTFEKRLTQKGFSDESVINRLKND